MWLACCFCDLTDLSHKCDLFVSPRCRSRQPIDLRTDQIQEHCGHTKKQSTSHLFTLTLLQRIPRKSHHLHFTHSLNNHSPDSRLFNHCLPRICQKYTDTNTLAPVDTASIPWPFPQPWWEEWLKPKYKKRRMSSSGHPVIQTLAFFHISFFTGLYLLTRIDSRTHSQTYPWLMRRLERSRVKQIFQRRRAINTTTSFQLR